VTGTANAVLLGVAALLGILAVKTEHEVVFAVSALLCGLCVAAGLSL
jgi:hypothetical protein